jgi:hypothetical protein
MKDSRSAWQKVKNSDQMVGMCEDFLEKIHQDLWNLEVPNNKVEKLYFLMEDIKHARDEIGCFRLRNSSDSLPE